MENPKTGKLWLCLDPKSLNVARRRPHHLMKTLRDFVSKLSGATCFSKLRIAHAYKGIMLDDKSFYFTTFSTPFVKLPSTAICPVGTWCQNVVSTSLRRNHVVSTLVRRHFYVMFPLGGICASSDIFQQKIDEIF